MMRCLFWLVAALSCPQSAGMNDWKLVWSDEFAGSGLDYGKWGVEVNALGGGNHELQFYTDRPENVRVEKGVLVIEAREDHPSIAGTTRRFSSARLRTKHRGDWLYGRVEVKARLPKGRGLWPAIWMLPTHEHYGGWAASGEIDIMELVGHEPAVIHGTLHHGNSWPAQEQIGSTHELAEGSFADAFHVFAVEWEAGEIRWYLDGDLWQTQKRWSTKGYDFPAPFDQPFHLLLNLAVGGKWPGSPNEETGFPARMEVDYVRVYQR